MNKQPVIEKLYFMLSRHVNECLCAVQGSYCACCSVSVWGMMMAFHESQHVDFISVVLHGLLAHISVIVYWRVAEWKHPLKSGSIFPFTSSCSYLVALHFSFSHTASFSEFFKLAAKIHRRIFNLCVPSFLQPLTEALRASTLRLAVTNGEKKQF